MKFHRPQKAETWKALASRTYEMFVGMVGSRVQPRELPDLALLVCKDLCKAHGVNLEEAKSHIADAVITCLAWAGQRDCSVEMWRDAIEGWQPTQLSMPAAIHRALVAVANFTVRYDDTCGTPPHWCMTIMSIENSANIDIWGKVKRKLEAEEAAIKSLKVAWESGSTNIDCDAWGGDDEE